MLDLQLSQWILPYLRVKSPKILLSLEKERIRSGSGNKRRKNQMVLFLYNSLVSLSMTFVYCGVMKKQRLVEDLKWKLRTKKGTKN